MKKLFTTAFYIAEKEKPFTDFLDLLLLQGINFGTKLNEHYASDKQAAVFISYIANEMRENLRSEIKKSEFFGLINDSCTDTGVIEEETIHIRLVDETGYPTNKFLALRNVEKADGEGIMKVLVSAMEENGKCTNWRQNLTNITTDGAPVMLGRKGGAVALIRADNCEHLIDFHCANHRLELAIKHGSKEVPYMEHLDTTLQNIYKFYHYSPLNWHGLQTSGKSAEIKVRRPVNIMGTRWVSYRLRALTVIDSNWKAMVQHLNQVSILEKSEKAPKAKGFLLTLKSVRFVLTMKLLLKLFCYLADLSCALQNNRTTIQTLLTKITVLKLQLENFNVRDEIPEIMKDNKIKEEAPALEGVSLTESSGRGRSCADVETVCKDFKILLEKYLEQINKKFGNLSQDSIVSNFMVFDPSLWPKQEKDLAKYGVSEVKTLTNHFKSVLLKNKFEPDKVTKEWSELLVQTRNMTVKPPVSEFWAIKLQEEEKKEIKTYSNILSIVKIMLVMAVSSAEAERAFSLMGRIKNDWRSALSPETLNDLMMIRLSSTTISTFDPVPAISLWLQGGKRKRRMVEPYGPRKSKPQLETSNDQEVLLVDGDTDDEESLSEPEDMRVI